MIVAVNCMCPESTTSTDAAAQDHRSLRVSCPEALCRRIIGYLIGETARGERTAQAKITSPHQAKNDKPERMSTANNESIAAAGDALG